MRQCGKNAFWFLVAAAHPCLSAHMELTALLLSGRDIPLQMQISGKMHLLLCLKSISLPRHWKKHTGFVAMATVENEKTSNNPTARKPNYRFELVKIRCSLKKKTKKRQNNLLTFQIREDVCQQLTCLDQGSTEMRLGLKLPRFACMETRQGEQTSSLSSCFNRNLGDSVTLLSSWDLQQLTQVTAAPVTSNHAAPNEAHNGA